jgi:hypothetical protein
MKLHYISDVGSSINNIVKQINVDKDIQRYLTNLHWTLGLKIIIS